MKKWGRLLTTLSRGFAVKESRETGQRIKRGITFRDGCFFF